MRDSRGPWTVVLALLFTGWVGIPASAECVSDVYHVNGVVQDKQGRAVPHANVYVLLDKISERKFHEQGVRVRRFRADERGRYHGEIVCGDGGGTSPCARKPRHLTVAADAAGHAMALRGFKLRDIRVDSTSQGCVIEAPAVALSVSH